MLTNKVSQALQSDWPFAAGRSPVFYGWVIAAFSTLGFLMSIPGQTMGMAVFAEAFIEATGLSRTQLSTAYLIGTLASATLLTRAGVWYDRVGARITILAASTLLAVMLVYLYLADVLGKHIADFLGLALPWCTLPLMTLGYFGVRFAGQGVLTSASRNVLLVWFERRRGLVSGVRGVFVSLGFSIAPLVIAALIQTVGWRDALLWMAAAVGVGFSLLTLIFMRDHPHRCGLQPDGKQITTADNARSKPSDRNATLAEARRNPVFWLYAMSLSIHALFGTALTFHIVAIFAAAGRSADEAFGYFIPSALVSVSTNLAASTLADHIRLKPLLVIMLIAFLCGAGGLLQLHTEVGYWLLVVGLGAGGGLWGVLSNLAYVRQFGTLHLGAISGLNTSLTVSASAIGPLLFSLGLDLFGSFDAAIYLCMVGLLLLLACGASMRQPLDLPPDR